MHNRYWEELSISILTWIPAVPTVWSVLIRKHHVTNNKEFIDRQLPSWKTVLTELQNLSDEVSICFTADSCFKQTYYRNITVTVKIYHMSILNVHFSLRLVKSIIAKTGTRKINHGHNEVSETTVTQCQNSEFQTLLLLIPWRGSNILWGQTYWALLVSWDIAVEKCTWIQSAEHVWVNDDIFRLHLDRVQLYVVYEKSVIRFNLNSECG